MPCTQPSHVSEVFLLSPPLVRAYHGWADGFMITSILAHVIQRQKKDDHRKAFVKVHNTSSLRKYPCFNLAPKNLRI